MTPENAGDTSVELSDILTIVGFVGAFAWNAYNTYINRAASKIAEFHRNVGGPLASALDQIERVADHCYAFHRNATSVDIVRGRLVGGLQDEVTNAHSAVLRCLRRTQTLKVSRFDDWDTVVDGRIDDDALDALATIAEDETLPQFEAERMLLEAAGNLEDFATRARKLITREG